MNIKEIARLAEVSVSTVSKIINGKDQHISAETRDRVRQIVKECNYTPYAGLHTVSKERTLLIGISITAQAGHSHLLTSMIESARAEGYGTIVCTSKDEIEEYKNLSFLCSHHVDGILWDQIDSTSKEAENLLQENNIPYQRMCSMEAPSLENACLDYQKLAYTATKVLVEQKHQHILCLVDEDSKKSRRFLRGFEECLYDNKIPFDAKMFQIVEKGPSGDSQQLLFEYTAILCSSVQLAAMVYEQANHKNRKIPRDVSVISLTEEGDVVHLYPKLAMVQLPSSQLGQYACRRLIAKMENRKQLELPFQTNPTVKMHNSVDVPITLRNKKIVVVGAMNIDSLISLGKFPKMGETITANRRATIPGGKGVNQAIGAAKLGAEVYLIGKVGKDYEGSTLYDFLQVNGVNVDGVTSTSKSATGHAYIYVQDDGESGIVIYDGANSQLSAQEIAANTCMFENASFCLLQTEIEAETVEYAAKTAKKFGAKVLLKPAAVNKLSDELLQNVDILIPNRNEMNTLYPEEASWEVKAQHFLDRGVQTVIVTLGHQGCYLRNTEYSEFFPAANFTPVDTTGAADAFAATLAVYLSRNYDLHTSIKYATYAAGFSTTRQGVPPSLIDKSTLDLYLSDE